MEQNQQVCPENYLGLSIFSMICCCMPLGIPAIIYSSRVKGLFNKGDYIGAQRCSKKARDFSMAAIAIGVLLTFLNIILQIAAESSNPYYY
tara:strand:- start:18 stop:290 length:273 start_codon:yes stop_codon:yes gene_type:complete